MCRIVRTRAQVRAAATPCSKLQGGGYDTQYVASVPGTGVGVLLAVEVERGSDGWRYPDALVETPYRTLPPASEVADAGDR